MKDEKEGRQADGGCVGVCGRNAVKTLVSVCFQWRGCGDGSREAGGGGRSVLVYLCLSRV